MAPCPSNSGPSTVVLSICEVPVLLGSVGSDDTLNTARTPRIDRSRDRFGRSKVRPIPPSNTVIAHWALSYSQTFAPAQPFVCFRVPQPDVGTTRGFSGSSSTTESRCLRTVPSALTWLRLSTPSPERPWIEPPKFRLATTSACRCCGATNCAAPLPSHRVPTHHSRLGAHIQPNPQVQSDLSLSVCLDPPDRSGPLSFTSRREFFGSTRVVLSVSRLHHRILIRSTCSRLRNSRPIPPITSTAGRLSRI